MNTAIISSLADQKSLRAALKDLVNTDLVFKATDIYRAGYISIMNEEGKRDLEDRWVETYPHYYLSDLEIAVRTILTKLKSLLRTPDKEIGVFPSLKQHMAARFVMESLVLELNLANEVVEIIAEGQRYTPSP